MMKLSHAFQYFLSFLVVLINGRNRPLFIVWSSHSFFEMVLTPFFCCFRYSVKSNLPLITSLLLFISCFYVKLFLHVVLAINLPFHIYYRLVCIPDRFMAIGLPLSALLSRIYQTLNCQGYR